ncbi:MULTISPECIES: APC family permease [unclassified Ruminococcus]|uniref:amino acid permease n=1 Tax=Ruminococcus sp. D55t1_190419_H1 TaxID=2787130 RepID=UPI001898EF72
MSNRESEFSKVLNTGDVLVVAFGAMIGWGWVVSSGQWITSGGVLGTVLGFIIGGIMIYFVGLCYAELTTAMPKCGGEHVFSYKAFGSIGAYICTWSIILSYIGVVCYEAVSFPTILQYVFPKIARGYLYSVGGFDIYFTWLLIAIGMALLILFLNIIGMKKAARFQKILTCVIAAVGIALVAGAAYSGNVNNLQNQLLVGDTNGEIIQNIAKVAIMTPFFLFGFDVIPQAAEEINVPLKKLGKMMILSIIMAVSFYVLVVLAVGYVMNAEQIKTSMLSATGLVTADAMGVAFNNANMAKVLIIGGLCGIVTSWNSFLIGGSRALYSMSVSYMLPRKFAVLHKKYNTPVNSLLLIGALSVISPFFGRSMLVWIVDAGNFACCFAYCIVSLSFIVLRRKEADMRRPYKVKHYKFVGIVAVIMSGTMSAMYIIPETNCTLVWQEWIIVGGWILLGIIMAYISKKKYGDKFANLIK